MEDPTAPQMYGPEGGVVANMSDEEQRDHVEMLTHRLLNENPAKAYSAAVAMASYIGDQRFLPAEEFEIHPAEVLAKTLAKPKPSKSESLNAVKALGIMGAHAAPHAAASVVRFVSQGDFELRWESIRSLRLMGQGAAAGNSRAPYALARSLLEEESASLRLEAARALGALGPGAATVADALAQATEDDDTDIQNASVCALGAMGRNGAKPKAVAALVRAMQRGSFEQRRLAVDAVSQMGSAAGEAAPVLARLLRPTPAGDVQLRIKAAQALANMGRPTIRQEQLWLAMAKDDPDARVREAAVQTLTEARCKRALKGSMFLLDPESDDENEFGPGRARSKEDSAEQPLPGAGAVVIMGGPLATAEEINLDSGPPSSLEEP